MDIVLVVIIQDLKHWPRKWDHKLNSLPECFKPTSPRM